jgi:hypothetical protein
VQDKLLLRNDDRLREAGEHSFGTEHEQIMLLADFFVMNDICYFWITVWCNIRGSFPAQFSPSLARLPLAPRSRSSALRMISQKGCRRPQPLRPTVYGISCNKCVLSIAEHGVHRSGSEATRSFRSDKTTNLYHIHDSCIEYYHPCP